MHDRQLVSDSGWPLHGTVYEASYKGYLLVDIKQLLAGAVERRRQPLVDQVQVDVRCIRVLCRCILQQTCQVCPTASSNYLNIVALLRQCREKKRNETSSLMQQVSFTELTCSCFSRAPAATEALRLPRRTSCDTLPRLADVSFSARAASPLHKQPCREHQGNEAIGTWNDPLI